MLSKHSDQTLVLPHINDVCICECIVRNDWKIPPNRSEPLTGWEMNTRTVRYGTNHERLTYVRYRFGMILARFGYDFGLIAAFFYNVSGMVPDPGQRDRL